MNNCENRGGLFPLFGGVSSNKLSNLELSDLLEDECDQIIISPELFNAFVNYSKGKKNFDRKKTYSLFKYVVYLYNDTLQATSKYGNLTYLTRISNLLEYLEIQDIVELSMEQLNMLLDLENDGTSIVTTYNSIKEKRHLLTEREFYFFVDMLRGVKSEKVDTKELRKVYVYIARIYNENPIIQDNVNYMDYLETFSKSNIQSITSLRMCQILELLKIQDINYENVNENKKLVNDLTESGIRLNTL